MSKEIPPGRDLNLSLKVTESGGASLHVRYEVENIGMADVYLFNRLWHRYTEKNIFELDPNLVYVSSQNGVVHLFKGSPDIPRTMSVEMPVIPCVTLLPQRQRFTETIQIEQPLHNLNPYLYKDHSIIPNPTAIVFSLGYFPLTEIGQRRVNYVYANLGKALFAYVTPSDQLVISSTPVPLTATSVPMGEKKFCTKCGTKQEPGSRYCSQCGAQL